jgi:putative ABC transport system ATP-binding protein
MIDVQTASGFLSASRSADAHLLTLERVSKDYQADGTPVRALHDVSLQVGQGDFIALVGKSGCGKSTLLNLAGAMDFPTSGHVLLDGIATDQLDDAQLTRLRREKVGFIFQSFQLLHTLSAVENVELPQLLAGHSDARPRAMERLAWVELDGLALRMPHQLSGGQMQRVAIARALVHSPDILIADEPTGNLDNTSGAQVLDLLRQSASRFGATVLLATHSAEAAAMADARIALRDGHIVP